MSRLHVNLFATRNRISRKGIHANRFTLSLGLSRPLSGFVKSRPSSATKKKVCFVMIPSIELSTCTNLTKHDGLHGVDLVKSLYPRNKLS